MRSVSILFAVAAAPGVAAASPADAELAHQAQVGAGPLVQLYVLGPDRERSSTTGWTIEATYGLRFLHTGIEAGGGARAVFGPNVASSAAFEGFAFGALGPELGAWRPRVGVELGWSGAADPAVDEDDTAPGSVLREFAGASPFYVGTALVPARFAVRGWLVETAAITIGTPVSGWGRSARLQVTFVRVGVSL
jgi:hypothetical protein